MPLTAPVVIPLGFVGVYLVPAGDGCVLVDTGVPKQEQRIIAGLAQHGFSAQDIRLIFITHVHGDHAGSVQALARLSGAPVLAHRIEAPALEQGISLEPVGLTAMGKIMQKFMGRFTKMASGFPCPAEIVVDDELSLADFGVSGRAIHTPGHTSGSVSLLLDSGEAFVGDLCAKMPISFSGSYVPFFGEDRAAVYASWQRLLDAGATQIFPGHATPFSASALRRELARVRRA